MHFTVADEDKGRDVAAQIVVNGKCCMIWAKT